MCCAVPCRDPTLPINRSEITRFPHAVLEVKLSLGQGQTSPAWVQVRGEGGGGQDTHARGGDRPRDACGGGLTVQHLCGPF